MNRANQPGFSLFQGSLREPNHSVAVLALILLRPFSSWLRRASRSRRRLFLNPGLAREPNRLAANLALALLRPCRSRLGAQAGFAAVCFSTRGSLRQPNRSADSLFARHFLGLLTVSSARKPAFPSKPESHLATENEKI